MPIFLRVFGYAGLTFVFFGIWLGFGKKLHVGVTMTGFCLLLVALVELMIAYG